MKKMMIVIMSGCMLMACNSSSSNQDSVDSAQNVNDSMAKASNDNKSGDSTASTTASTTPVDSKTSDFATEAAEGGMAEVQLGQLAQQKAQSQRVKDFGAMMVKDHTQANDELKTIAAQKNIALPATLSDKHQKSMADLSKKSGKDFDKAYMDMMVDDHKEDVKKFKDAADDVKDNDVKAFASKSVPILQMHLDSAQAVQKSVK